jgi:hypothetical protein
MNQAESLLITLRGEGFRIQAHGENLRLGPKGRITPELIERVRSCKPALLEILCRQSRSVEASDSRHPLIGREVRTKIENIEGEARRLGWPPELLWNNSFWDLPRGLAAVVDDEDEIVQVAYDQIKILKTHRDILVFRRHNA